MTDPVYGDELLYTETNFRDEAFRKVALTQDYNISITGGKDWDIIMKKDFLSTPGTNDLTLH